MSDHAFWLSEAQFGRFERLLPNTPRGVPRVDDRRVVSEIIHVIGGRLVWRDTFMSAMCIVAIVIFWL